MALSRISKAKGRGKNMNHIYNIQIIEHNVLF